SAVGFGSMTALRGWTLVLFTAGCAVRSRPWLAFCEQRIAQLPAASRMLAMALFTWLLVLYAHTVTAVGYDALWHGLGGARVLVAAGSVFAAQGLVSRVFYFPKVYELFLAPLSGLGSSSVLAGVGILLVGLLMAVAWVAMRQLHVGGSFARLAAAALCA